MNIDVQNQLSDIGCVTNNNIQTIKDVHTLYLCMYISVDEFVWGCVCMCVYVSIYLCIGMSTYVCMFNPSIQWSKVCPSWYGRGGLEGEA